MKRLIAIAALSALIAPVHAGQRLSGADASFPTKIYPK